MQRDMHNNVDEKNALNVEPITTNTTTVGNIIDTAGFESLEFVVVLGDRTDGTYTLKLEDGDNSGLSDAADVAADLRLGALTAMNASDQVARIGYIGHKRYVRLSIVSTGVTTGVDAAGAIAILGHPMHAPVAQ